MRIGSKATARMIAEFHYNDREDIDTDTFTRIGRGADRTAYLHEDGFVYKLPTFADEDYWSSMQMKDEVKNFSTFRRADLKYVVVPNAHMFVIKIVLNNGTTRVVYITAMDFLDCEPVSRDHDQMAATRRREEFRAAIEEISKNSYVEDLHLGNISPIRGSNYTKYGLMDAGI